MPQPSDTVAALLTDATLGPASPAIAVPDSFGGWFDLSRSEFVERVRALAKGFLAAGLAIDDRVAVLCSLRYEITLVDVAAALVGAAVVPLDPDLDQSDLAAVLETSRARAVVVETIRDFARVDELHGDLPLVSDVWQLALGDLDKVASAGRAVDDGALEARILQVRPETVLTVYPSAAGGAVEVTQGVAVARARSLAEALRPVTRESDSTLLTLPPTEIDSRLVALLALTGGIRLGHLADPARLIDAMASFRPTLLVARPEMLEAIDAAAVERASATGRGAALRQAIEVGLEWSAAQEAGPLSRGLRTRYALADTLVFRGLRKAVGGRLRTAVVLADQSSLPTRLRHLMRALDVRPLEGFGTPATSGLALVERPDDPFARPVGGVGSPLAGVRVGVSESGGLRMRGAGIRGGTAPGVGVDGAGAGGVGAGGVLDGTDRSAGAGSGFLDAGATERGGDRIVGPVGSGAADVEASEAGGWLDLDVEADIDEAGRVTLADREVVVEVGDLEQTAERPATPEGEPAATPDSTQADEAPDLGSPADRA